MNYETLFIAVNVFDRFLAKSFMHKLAFYELAAIVSAFIAIKYNEEFDPVIKTSLTIADRVNVFYIKDFIVLLFCANMYLQFWFRLWSARLWLHWIGIFGL